MAETVRQRMMKLDKHQLNDLATALFRSEDGPPLPKKQAIMNIREAFSDKEIEEGLKTP